MVRVGFLGAGFIARYHAKSLQSADVEVAWTGVFDPDDSKAEGLAAITDAPICKTEQAVLDNCDAVYICAWTAEHPRLVEAAASRGLAVFCEKPLAINLTGAESMLATVRATGVINQVGLVLRHSPAFALAKALAANPNSGRPMCVVFRDDHYITIQGIYESAWRSDPAKAGAGTLLEHSIHDLDLLEWMLGPITSVCAYDASFHELDGIEDSVTVALRFASGAVGSLVSVWHDVLERPSLRRVEVMCERTHITIEGDWSGPVEWLTTGSAPVRLEHDDLIAEARRRGAALGNPDAGFIQAVAAGKPAWPSLAEAHRAHVVADAIYRSIRSRRIVEPSDFS